MQKTVLLLLITFGTLFAKSYNFQETRYISALDKNIVLNGIIDFKKDSIKIEYKKQNKIVEYSNADIKLYQNGKEVELAKEQKSFMVQYFEILNLLHNNSEEILSDDVLATFREAVEKGDVSERAWKKLLMDVPLVEQNKTLEVLQNPDFSRIQFPDFEEGVGVATRDSNGQILNAISKAIPGFIGGSADLSPSNKTELKGMGIFPNGKNIYFGIREHAMGAITNAMSLYGLFIPFSATFFVFSDYMKPAVRLAALMSLKNYFIWTHDSIGVGEDGPTHQPIEHLSQFRALPNFYVFRPADASENVACWKKALELDAPSGFVLSRQKLKTLKSKVDVGDASRGGYMVKKREDATVTIIATGSEVMPSLQAACHLKVAGIKANVVSVPCFDLFNEQEESYRKSVVSPDTKVLAVEAGSGIEWYRYANVVLGMNSFGASGDANILFEHFGFTVKGIKKAVFEMVGEDYKETEINDCKI